MTDLVYRDESFKIISACLSVHSELGCGFMEKVYQDALEIEFKMRGIPYEKEKHITIQYKGQTIDHDYFADFVCYDKIIVELKAVKELADIHKKQVINYLRATNMELGLLVNFGEKSLRSERLVNWKK